MKILSIKLICFLFCFIHFALHAQFKVVGYMPTWSNFNTQVNTIDWSKFTHVNISFANPNASGVFDEGLTDTQMETFVTKVHDAEGKILISIGGAVAPDYTNFLTTTNRAAFVQSLVDYITKYNLDGVDVDLEGSNVPANYGVFVQDLGAALQPKGKLVTAALGYWFSNKISDAALNVFDWINLMAYDETGSWAPQNPGQHSSYEKAEFDIDHWTGRGISKDKLVLGVPFYGYNFDNKGKSTAYNTIVTTNTGAENFDQVGQLFYNGQPTMKQKTELAIDECSGIMIWEITQDVPVTDKRSLLQTIHNTIDNNISGPTVSFITPLPKSSYLEGDSILLQAEAIDTNGTVKSVDYYANGKLLGSTTESPWEFNWTNGAVGSYSLTAVATDNDDYSTVTTIQVDIRVPQAAFNGPHTIPGTIQTEDYDLGGGDSAFYDLTKINSGSKYRQDAVDIESTIDGGNGSFNVGWIDSGEWLEYTVNVTKTDNYHLDTRVASSAGGGIFKLQLDGADLTNNITVTSTGGWQKWATISTNNIQLTEGDHIIRIVFTKGGFNFNHFAFFPMGVDCNGDLNGTASLDACGICAGGETEITPSTSELDCVIGLTDNVSQPFSLYPNPTTGLINIQHQNNFSSWVLTDIMGTSLLTGSSEKLDISHVSNGLYLLMIDGKTYRITKN